MQTRQKDDHGQHHTHLQQRELKQPREEERIASRGAVMAAVGTVSCRAARRRARGTVRAQALEDGVNRRGIRSHVGLSGTLLLCRALGTRLTTGVYSDFTHRDEGGRRWQPDGRDTESDLQGHGDTPAGTHPDRHAERERACAAVRAGRRRLKTHLAKT